MNAQEIIARRVALELREGMLVNLGIGLPTMVANYISTGLNVFLQSENGLIGLDARPPEGMEDDDLTDAGGGYVTAIPGATRIDSVMSFGLIRGGHLDITVLGGLQVDAKGLLANWMIPGVLAPGMGGAMDLVTGAKQVIVAMQHTAKDGASKIVPECTWPLTSIRPVSQIVTNLAFIEVTPGGLLLKETAPGVSVETVIKATAASLMISPTVCEMVLSGSLTS
jgi:acetate CoA/acetoacetate CoA-transferase beta subunit